MLFDRLLVKITQNPLSLLSATDSVTLVNHFCEIFTCNIKHFFRLFTSTSENLSSLDFLCRYKVHNRKYPLDNPSYLFFFLFWNYNLLFWLIIIAIMFPKFHMWNILFDCLYIRNKLSVKLFHERLFTHNQEQI